MILFGHTDNQGILLGVRESRFEPWGSSIRGLCFSSWYVICIDIGHVARSPQSSPRWSPAFKMEPVLFLPSVLPLEKLTHIYSQEFTHMLLRSSAVNFGHESRKSMSCVNQQGEVQKLEYFGGLNFNVLVDDIPSFN